jgi:hypothetical protein
VEEILLDLTYCHSQQEIRLAADHEVNNEQPIEYSMAMTTNLIGKSTPF